VESVKPPAAVELIRLIQEYGKGVSFLSCDPYFGKDIEKLYRPELFLSKAQQYGLFKTIPEGLHATVKIWTSKKKLKIKKVEIEIPPQIEERVSPVPVVSIEETGKKKTPVSKKKGEVEHSHVRNATQDLSVPESVVDPESIDVFADKEDDEEDVDELRLKPAPTELGLEDPVIDKLLISSNNELSFHSTDVLQLDVPYGLQTTIPDTLVQRAMLILEKSATVTDALIQAEEEAKRKELEVAEALLPPIPEVRIMQVIKKPEVRSTQPEGWLLSVVKAKDIPKYDPPPSQTTTVDASVMEDAKGKKPVKAPLPSKEKEKGGGKGVEKAPPLQEEVVQDVPVAVVEGPKFLSEEQAIYLYPPPTLPSPLYNLFCLLPVPGGLYPLSTSKVKTVKDDKHVVKSLEGDEENRSMKKAVLGMLSQSHKGGGVTERYNLGEVIPFSFELDNVVPSSRFVVPPRSELIIAVAYRSGACGIHNVTFHFETVETHRVYAVKCSAICCVPSIIRNPQNIFHGHLIASFPSDSQLALSVPQSSGDSAPALNASQLTAAGTSFISVKKQFVEKIETFVFGPLLNAPLEKLFGNAFATVNPSPTLSVTPKAMGLFTQKLLFQNNGVFSAKILFSFQKFVSSVTSGAPEEKADKKGGGATAATSTPQPPPNPILLSDISTSARVSVLNSLLNTPVAQGKEKKRGNTPVSGMPGGVVMVGGKDAGKGKKDAQQQPAGITPVQNEPQADYPALRVTCSSNMPSFFLSTDELTLQPNESREIEMYGLPQGIGNISGINIIYLFVYLSF
jgi:hypothetical protein